MYFYFSSDSPAAIKISGIYYASVFKSVAFLDFYPPYPLVEILPLSSNKNGFAFFPDENFLSNPPQNVTVTDLKGGYFLDFSFSEEYGKFRVIGQKKFPDAAVTLFFDNGYKLSLETARGFLAENYSFAVEKAEFTRHDFFGAKTVFAEYFSGAVKILNVYSVSGEPKLIFSREIEDFTVTAAGFTVTEKKKDAAKHVVKSVWEITESRAEEKERTVSHAAGFDLSSIPEKLIPYAFTEELLVGGDIGGYLGGTVKENAENLKPFFGDFIGVFPPPIFRNPDEVGVIYKLKDRSYAAEYFTFTVENRKITGIVKK